MEIKMNIPCPKCYSKVTSEILDGYYFDPLGRYICHNCHCVWTAWQQDLIEKAKKIIQEILDSSIRPLTYNRITAEKWIEEAKPKISIKK